MNNIFYKNKHFESTSMFFETLPRTALIKSLITAFTIFIAENALAGFGTITNPIAGDNSAYSGESFGVYAEYDDTGCNDGVTISVNSGSCTTPGFSAYPAGCGTHGGTATFTMSANPTIKCEIRIRGDASLSGEQITYRNVLIDQDIQWGVPGSSVIGDTNTITAPAKTKNGTNLTGMGVTLSASGACSIAGMVVTSNSAGTCTLTANIAGNANFTAINGITTSWTVNKKTQIITPTQPAGPLAYGTVFTASAITNAPGLTINSITASGGCTIQSGGSTSSATVKITSGTTACTITYAQTTGNATYNTGTLNGTAINVTKIAQTITVNTSQSPSSVRPNDVFNVVADCCENRTLTYTITSGPCSLISVVGGTAGFNADGEGTCAIKINRAADNDYTVAAQVSWNVTIAKGTQNITFPAAAWTVPYTPDGTYRISGVTATSGFAVSYTTTVPSAPYCQLTSAGNDVVVIKGVGTCVLLGNQSGNAGWSAAPQATKNLVITQGSQAVTVTQSVPATIQKNTSFVVKAQTNTVNPVVITAQSGDNCVVSSSSVTGNVTTANVLAASTTGRCRINYNITATANYLAATTISEDSTVTLTQQDITITQQPSALVALNTVFTTAAVSSSGLPVAITQTGGCTGAGGNSPQTFTLTSGTVPCVLTYKQAGNLTYDPAPDKTYTVEAIRSQQTISLAPAAPAKVPYNNTFTVSASSNASLTVAITVSGSCAFEAGSPSVAGSTTSATIRMTSSTSNCTVFYNQAGNDSYKPAAQLSNVVKEGTSPVISVGTAVPSPTNQTPEFTFTTDESGTIVYGGSCSSSTVYADIGSNNIVLNELAVGTYSNCTLKVVDANGNYSSVISLGTFTVVANVVAYVMPDSAGTGDCTSWANACSNIQTAINTGGVNEVWIAKGIYRPASTINLKSSQAIYGGFAGSETSRNKAMPSKNLTIISGDTAGDDYYDSRGLAMNKTDLQGTNLSRLLSASNLTTVDGKMVKVSGLVLNAAQGSVDGAALRVLNSNVSLDKMQITLNVANSGGAVFVDAGKLQVSDTLFLRNESVAAGGAIAAAVASDSTVSVSSSMFDSNIGGTNGGAINQTTGQLTLLNTTFYANSLGTTTGSGGAINLGGLAYPDTASIKYVTMLKNRAGTLVTANGRGGAINITTAATGDINLANSLIEDNSAATGANIADMANVIDKGYNIVGYSGASGMVSGAGNTLFTFGAGSSTTPSAALTAFMEVSPANNGGYTPTLKLKAGGYAVDRIPNIHADCAAANAVGVDQRGRARPEEADSYCDVGAYEFDSLTSCNDPTQDQGFFIGFYPSVNKACGAAVVQLTGGQTHPFYLILLGMIGWVKLRKRMPVKCKEAGKA